MKSVLRSVVIAATLLMGVAFAQSGTDFVATGGVIVRAGTKLFVPSSTITSCSDTLNVNTQVTGSFSLVTPTLASGTIAGPGVFNAGGSVSLTANGQYCQNFTGTLDAGATWSMVTLANGTHNYTLTGTFGGGKGAFVLQTTNIGKETFNGAEGVYAVDIHLN